MIHFKIFTLGCKVNTYESEAIKLSLIEQGYILDGDQIDLVIINTCAVTSTSEKKSRQIIRRYIRLHPKPIIAVMGCYSQIEASAIAEIDGVNIVIGTNNRLQIVEFIETFVRQNKQIISVVPLNQNIEYEKMQVTHYSDKTRAFVKIQDGCNNYCSFCIIPYARGKQRSRDKNDILNEIKFLIANGYREIVLTGIHTSGYGLDLDGYTFTDLVEEIIFKNPSLFRLRISSIEISEITSRLLKIIKDNPVLANHLHIPLQSGSDFILNKMNRKYSALDYENKIKEIVSLLPDIAITTDIIVGFSHESEDDFLHTYNLSKRLGFAKIHVFPYSPRIETAAYKFADDVDFHIKKQRVHRLIDLSHQLEQNYANRFKGKPLDIIVEEYDEKLKVYIGHTSNYLKASSKQKNLLIGDIAKIIYQN